MQVIDSIKSLLGIGRTIAAQATYSIQTYNQIYPSIESYKAIAAYKTLDDIFSVVSLLAQTSADIPLYGYDGKGEDLPENDRLTVFLRSFTYRQRLEMYTWVYLRDECFMYKDKTLGVNGKVEKIVFLNPSFVTIAVSDFWPMDIVGYAYRDPNAGVDRVFMPDEIVHIYGFNPSDNYQEMFRGLSRISVLNTRLNRLNSNMKNSVSQMQNGGVPGVMFIKDLPHNGNSKQIVDAVKNNFSKFATNSANKGAPFIQAGEMGYFSIGSSLADLNSMEMETVDFKKICNVWKVSDRLFNNDATGSEVSDDNARKGLYINAVNPTVRMVEDALNTQLVTDFGSGVRVIRHDFSGIVVLQENLKDTIDAMAASPVMIPNDVLEVLGYDRVDNPTMDQPLIKSGYEHIDNFEPLPPIE